MLVDSHCHLDYSPMIDDLAGTVARARSAGVGTMLTIGTKLRDFPKVRAIAEANDSIFCSVGIHPHEAQNEAADTEKLVEDGRHGGVAPGSVAGTPPRACAGSRRSTIRF